MYRADTLQWLTYDLRSLTSLYERKFDLPQGYTPVSGYVSCLEVEVKTTLSHSALGHRLTVMTVAFFEKLTLAHLVENFPAFDVCRRFMSVFARDRHWSFSLAG